MQTSHSVPGEFNRDLRFVTGDMYGIADRVKEYDADARLAQDAEDGHLCIVRFARNLGEGLRDGWVLAFMCNDPETGTPLTSPDARVVNLMQVFDSWSRKKPGDLERKARIQIKKQQARELIARRDAIGDTAQRTVHGWKARRGVKSKIFVPGHLA